MESFAMRLRVNRKTIFEYKLNIIDRNIKLIQKNLTRPICHGKIFFVIFKMSFFSYTYNHFKNLLIKANQYIFTKSKKGFF